MEDRLIRIEDKLEKILIQTTRTNGRVDAHDDKFDSHDQKLEKHDKIISGILAEDNQTKGRDKVIWIILGIIGTLASMVIGHYL